MSERSERPTDAAERSWRPMGPVFRAFTRLAEEAA